jgi:hypothetical protein
LEKVKLNDELKQVNESLKQHDDESSKKIKLLEEVNINLQNQNEESKKSNVDLVCLID